MTTTIVAGDLLASDCNILIHQANCQNVMKSGIAKSLSQMYPDILKTDRDFLPPPRDKNRLGTFSIHHEYKKNIRIYNLYGQFNYGKGLQTDYISFEFALEGIFKNIHEFIVSYILENGVAPYIKIGMPYKIACKRAGGDWEIVSKMIEDISNKYGLPVHLYNIHI